MARDSTMQGSTIQKNEDTRRQGCSSDVTARAQQGISEDDLLGVDLCASNVLARECEPVIPGTSYASTSGRSIDPNRLSMIKAIVRMCDENRKRKKWDL